MAVSETVPRRLTERGGAAGRGARPGVWVGCLAQLVERRPYKANVGGSSPSAPTKINKLRYE